MAMGLYAVRAKLTEKTMAAYVRNLNALRGEVRVLAREVGAAAWLHVQTAEGAGKEGAPVLLIECDLAFVAKMRILPHFGDVRDITPLNIPTMRQENLGPSAALIKRPEKPNRKPRMN